MSAKGQNSRRRQPASSNEPTTRCLIRSTPFAEISPSCRLLRRCGEVLSEEHCGLTCFVAQSRLVPSVPQIGRVVLMGNSSQCPPLRSTAQQHPLRVRFGGEDTDRIERGEVASPYILVAIHMPVEVMMMFYGAPQKLRHDLVSAVARNTRTAWTQRTAAVAPHILRNTDGVGQLAQATRSAGG